MVQTLTRFSHCFVVLYHISPQSTSETHYHFGCRLQTYIIIGANWPLTLQSNPPLTSASRPYSHPCEQFNPQSIFTHSSFKFFAKNLNDILNQNPYTCSYSQVRRAAKSILPAATASPVATTSSTVASKAIELLSKNAISTYMPMRLLPSRKAWLAMRS